jgi:hypothetical protein
VRLLKLLLGLSLLLQGVVHAGAPRNILTITEAAGATQQNYPIQIGRPFAQGEIAGYPQAGICSDASCSTVTQWLPTQANVKRRHADGTVRHAILSFLLPSIGSRANVSITFRNQAESDNAPLSTEQMLEPAFDFDAGMRLTASGITKTVSARDILSQLTNLAPCSNIQREPCVWASGPVATTVLLADHTTKAYDTGFQQDKASTMAADWGGGDTTLTVADASGWTAPMHVRVKNETIAVCAINGNVLSVGATTCPNANGRAVYASNASYGYASANTPVYPDESWKEPDAAHTSFRPAFHVTFWPGIHKVWIRFSGEDSDVTKAGDQIYSLVLTTGHASPVQVYSNALVRQQHLTRWTKSDYWIGGAPANINIDHNLNYLRYTNFIYNFDPQFKGGITESTIANEYNAFVNDTNGNGHDLYQPAFYGTNTYMPAGGGTGRGELGPYPRYQVRWLYTGDWRELYVSKRMADLSGAWPVHAREGDNTRKFDLAGTQGAGGKVMSTRARPSLCAQGNFSNAQFDQLPADKFTYVGGTTQARWYPDVPHTNDSMTLLYMLTGEYYYLEEAWFFSSFETFWGVGNDSNTRYGRGPALNGLNGKYTAYAGELRGLGRGLQQLGQTALITPDGYDEGAYFDAAVRETLAVEEGSKFLRSSPNATNEYADLFKYGLNFRQRRDWVNTNDPPSPLGMYGYGGRYDDPNWCNPPRNDTSKAGYCVDIWEQLLLLKAFGRMQELGYDFSRLLDWAGKPVTEILTTPGVSKYLLDFYTIGSRRRTDFSWMTSWAETQDAAAAGYVSSYGGWTMLDNPDHSYCYFALGAAAYLYRLPNGKDAYASMYRDCGNTTALTQNPKDALIPRLDPTRVIMAQGGPTVALLFYVAPDEAACTVSISTNANFSNPLYSASDGGDKRLRAVLARELALNSNGTYYYRISCSQDSYNNGNTDGVLSMVPGGASSTVLVSVALPSVGGVAVSSVTAEYGSTSGLGSTTSAVACTGGCTVSIPAAAGEAVYYRLTYHDASGVALATGDIKVDVAR